MWIIASSTKGYYLCFDGKIMAELYGFSYEWRPVLSLLNKEFVDVSQFRKLQKVKYGIKSAGR
jgi:hypothetical protein